MRDTLSVSAKGIFRSLATALTMISCSSATEKPVAGILKINPDKTVHETRRQNLIGSNIALWNQTWELFDSECLDYVRELGPAYIRMPGGSWANHYYWNGNGVRHGENFDLSKLKDGVWQVDFSGYKPGFSIQGSERIPVADNFHGNADVKQLHELIGKFGAEAVVTVNVGTGTPEMAAEWVRWANKKMGFHVKYWELGNELEGRWELGHILPDGTKITGEIYAQRFKAFAEAMKAVDPSIKTGGPASSNLRGAFIPELLRDAGGLVDFISLHTYPVENRVKTEAAFFNQAADLEPAVKKIRGWIGQYQPERKEQIEVAVTEWNSKVVEDRDTGDLLNGLWSCIWIGEMFRTGVSFANQWDMLTATETGGHGLFYFKQFNFNQPGVPQKEMDRQFASFNPPCIPKGQYWAFYLWSRFMGDRMVESSLTDTKDVYAAVTRSSDELQILLVNKSRENIASIRLDSSLPLSGKGTAVQLSHREYFWNPYSRAPQWSRRPEPSQIDLNADAAVSIPPFSALVIRVPFTGKTAAAPAAGQPSQVESRIELLVPESSPEDVPVEAWVLVSNPGPYTPNEEPLTAELQIEGPATSDRQIVRINEGAGRFFIRPNGTGKITVTAQAGTKQTSAVLHSLPVVARTEILWTFEGSLSGMGLRSDYALTLSDSVKPNQQTAAVRLDNVTPAASKDTLLTFEPLPNTLPKERVGGFAFEVRTSHDFSCDDLGVSLQVVLQSSENHWIPVGSVPLTGLKDGWKTVELPIRDHEALTSMKWLYAVRIQLVAVRPVNGEIYIDNAGMILR